MELLITHPVQFDCLYPKESGEDCEVPWKEHFEGVLAIAQKFHFSSLRRWRTRVSFEVTEQKINLDNITRGKLFCDFLKYLFDFDTRYVALGGGCEFTMEIANARPADHFGQFNPDT